VRNEIFFVMVVHKVSTVKAFMFFTLSYDYDILFS